MTDTAVRVPLSDDEKAFIRVHAVRCSVTQIAVQLERPVTTVQSFLVRRGQPPTRVGPRVKEKATTCACGAALAFGTDANGGLVEWCTVSGRDPGECSWIQ